MRQVFRVAVWPASPVQRGLRSTLPSEKGANRKDEAPLFAIHLACRPTLGFSRVQRRGEEGALLDDNRQRSLRVKGQRFRHGRGEGNGVKRVSADNVLRKPRDRNRKNGQRRDSRSHEPNLTASLRSVPSGQRASGGFPPPFRDKNGQCEGGFPGTRGSRRRSPRRFFWRG